MKKIIIATAMSIAVATVLVASSSLDEIKMLKIFNKPSVSIGSFSENESTYQVKGMVRDTQGAIPFEAFVTKDYKEVIFGKGFESSTEKSLNIPIDIELMKKTAAFTIGDGADEYFLVTDPQCPFCQNLEKLMPQLSKNAKFYVFLFPLNIHNDAKLMSYNIMSKPDNVQKAKAMHDTVNGDTDFMNVKLSQNDIIKFDADLKKQFEAANVLGQAGTPSIFDVEGNKVEYPDLVKRYKVVEPADITGGVNFLEKNNLEITLNDATAGKEPLYVFTTVGEIKKLKDVETKYKAEKSIRVFLKLDSALKDINVLKAVYTQADNDTRVKLLQNLIDGKEIDKKLIDTAQAMSKEEETKYLPVAYAMQKMRLNADATFLMVDSRGHIVE